MPAETVNVISSSGAGDGSYTDINGYTSHSFGDGSGGAYGDGFGESDGFNSVAGEGYGGVGSGGGGSGKAGFSSRPIQEGALCLLTL